MDSEQRPAARAAPATVVPLPRLRPATAADAAGIVRLLAAVAEEGMLGLDPASLRVEEEAARLARLDLRRACALVVVLEGQVQGFAVAVRGAEAAIAHTATVSVAVAPDCRRRGYGRWLLEGLRAWAAAAGVRKLVASVCARNAAALALFRRCGYWTEGVRRQQLCMGGTLADEVLLGTFVDRPETGGAARRGPAPVPPTGAGQP